MINLMSFALFFLSAGIFTSVSILSVYQILITIPLAYYTFITIKKKNLNIPASAWFLIAFTAVALLSLIVNYELIPKPSKNFGRLKYFIFGITLIFSLKMWIESTTIKTKKILINTFLVTIIAAGLCAIYYRLSSPVGRVRSFTDTMRYGYGTGMIMLVLLSSLLQRSKLKNLINIRLGLAALAFGLIGMYLTNTRGAILGFVCGLPFVLYYYKPKLGLLFGIGAIVSLSVLGGFYLFGKTSQENKGSRYLMNKDNRSDVIRRSQWKAAFISIQEKPVLGWGLSNFHSQLARIKNQYDLDEKEYNDAHSHNLFLEIGSGTGLIGLVLFLGWVFCWAWESFKSDILIRSLIIPFGVSFVTSSQFEVTFDANNASMIFFVYALSCVVKDNVKQS